MPGLLSWVVTVIRGSKYEASDVVPGPGSNIRHPLSVFPFLHRVLRDQFPGFISTMRVLRLLAVHPAALRLAVPRLHSFYSLLDGRVRRRDLELVTRYLHPGMDRGNELDLPSSWGISIVRLHVFPRRRQDCSHQTITMLQRGPWTPRPLDPQVQRLPRLVFRRPIARLSDSLSTLRRVRYLTTTQDSLPVAGQALPDGLSTHKIPMKGFKIVYLHLYPPLFRRSGGLPVEMLQFINCEQETERRSRVFGAASAWGKRERLAAARRIGFTIGYRSLEGERTMPDGSRKRRFSTNLAKRKWYAQHRSRRFRRRFGVDN